MISFRLATFHLEDSPACDLSHIVNPDGHMLLRFRALNGGDNCLLDFLELEVLTMSSPSPLSSISSPPSPIQSTGAGSIPAGSEPLATRASTTSRPTTYRPTSGRILRPSMPRPTRRPISHYPHSHPHNTNSNANATPTPTPTPYAEAIATPTPAAESVTPAPDANVNVEATPTPMAEVNTNVNRAVTIVADIEELAGSNVNVELRFLVLYKMTSQRYAYG